MKIFLYILGGLVAIVAALGIFAPRDFLLERNIVINRAKDQVFNELKFLKKHEQWNAWSQKDPKMKKEFKGTDGTVGFISSWESENEEVGTAEQEIKSIVEGEKLDTQIRFKKPFEGSFSSYLTTTSVGENQTKVIIGMSDRMSFPINVISFIVNVCFDQQQKIIQNMDDSLKNLKSLLEK
ncbi:SRPBCC family protein [Leptospira sp. WS92.C1]